MVYMSTKIRQTRLVKFDSFINDLGIFVPIRRLKLGLSGKVLHIQQ